MTVQGDKIVATNRRARHDYELRDIFECGLVLTGSEVKSLREASAQIAEAWGEVDGGEAWVNGLHIAPYRFSQGFSGHDPDRRRKLLLNRREIERIRQKMALERLALVPLRLYFHNGKAKLEMALAKGRTKGDKRQAIAERDSEREARKEMGQALKRSGVDW